MNGIRTVAAPHRHEIERVRGSRFVADVAPAETEAAALEVVAAARAREPTATHHCWAFHLEDGRARSSDDGEPGGAAGPPILQRIDGAGLVDVVVVVTRYFGGTKLGRGGLIRAYGTAAAAVLADAPLVERPPLTTVTLSHGYDLSGPVEGVLAAYGAVVVDADYGADIGLRVSLPRAAAAAFAAAIRDATAGRVDAAAGDADGTPSPEPD